LPIWDAAPVGADAGKVFALDHRDLHAQLGCTNGSDIAAGAGADDDDVVGLSHCCPAFSTGPRDSGVPLVRIVYKPSITRTMGSSPRPIARVFSAVRCTPSSGLACATDAAS